MLNIVKIIYFTLYSLYRSPKSNKKRFSNFKLTNIPY